MDLIRTLLFIPGNRPNMLEKGATLKADALVPDLEDSVPPQEKANARAIVAEYLPKLAGNRVFVRVNGMQTGWTWDDLKAVVCKEIEGISIGKMESAEMAREVAALLTVLEQERGLPEGHVKIIPWIEMAKGVVNVREIALSTPRMLGLAFGAEDYTADMGIARTKDPDEVATAQAFTSIAARAAGILAFDTPDADFNDIDGLVREARRAKAMGYNGKFVIHPNQIAPVNGVFRPSLEEIEYARRVVEVFEEAQQKGSAATVLDGRMVDTPIWRRALTSLETAEAIERHEAARPG